MRFYPVYLLIAVLLISAISCRKDFEFSASQGDLEFSRDTVFLDTIFSNIGSSTYILKVYNRSKDAIEIPTIRLKNGDGSDYRLNVDGEAGKFFTDVPLMAEDSLFIFIETTFDVSNMGHNEFLYVDVLEFDSGDRLQEVPLITLVKEAIFLFPQHSETGAETVLLGFDADGKRSYMPGFKLNSDQLTFTNEKPYVIYGYAIVPRQSSLTVQAGARIHFHKDSGIFVEAEASIKILGELSSDTMGLEKEVIFEGDRLEPEFEDRSGQWGGIWIGSGSTENDINYLTIKNAAVGLSVEGDGTLQTKTLHIKNTQIHNSGRYNLWAKTAVIEGENLVLGKAGSSSLYCSQGGDYRFVHTTIANYWTESFRAAAALAIDNQSVGESGTQISADLIKADFLNCIIDGNGGRELSLFNSGSNIFNYFFSHCQLKFDGGDEESSLTLYDFKDGLKYENMILGEEIGFRNIDKKDFRLLPTSPAINRGSPETALTVPIDILGRERLNGPDIGAYEFSSDN